MQLFHVIYYSKANPEIGHDDLLMILKTSIRKNLENGITGFLIFREQYFVQLLEGTNSQVNELLEKIRHDKRHSGVTVIAEYSSDERIVPDWSMALVDSKTAASSAMALIKLFDGARGKHHFDTRDSLELILRKFSKDAEVLSEK